MNMISVIYSPWSLAEEGLIKMVSLSISRLERKSAFYLAAIVFRLSLELSYVYFIHSVFEYEGYALDWDGLKYIESWVIFGILLSNFPKKLNKPSDYLMVYMLFSFIVPLLIFYSYANYPRYHLYLVLLCVVLIMYFRTGRFIRIPTINKGWALGNFLLVFIVLMATMWMVYQDGFRYFNLDLSKVYDYREDVADKLEQGVMSYIIVWASKVAGPVLLAICLWKRKFFLAALVIALHVVWFGISAHKGVLFYPGLVLSLWYWFRRTRALAIVAIIYFSIVLGCLAFYLLFNEVAIGSMFIRRVFFVPARLTFVYYEFFSDNPFVYWSQTFGSLFVDYPYELNTGKLIGDYLGTGAAANNSFFATGYMHAGVVGVVIYGVLVGLLMRLIDSIAQDRIPAWLAVSAIIVPAQALIISSDLMTSMLTHGFGVALLMLLLLRGEFVKNHLRPLVTDNRRHHPAAPQQAPSLEGVRDPDTPRLSGASNDGT